jgi:hypothetical protein
MSLALKKFIAVYYLIGLLKKMFLCRNVYQLISEKKGNSLTEEVH